MANGTSGTKGSGSTTANSPVQAAPTVSTTSTGGKIVNQGNGQWWGENDNGVAVAILDAGKSDINLYKYGSKQIYEVERYESDEAKKNGAEDPKKLYVATKTEAMNLAKGWLKANQPQSITPPAKTTKPKTTKPKATKAPLTAGEK